jgi:transcriptional regulator with XRE-family HTH domain
VPPDPDAAALGARMRAIRQRRRMPLRVLSERAALSESFLSQLERGLTQASISSMRRIAEALDIHISDLFSPVDSDRPRVLRRNDRPNLKFGEGATKYLLTGQRPLENIEVLMAVIEPGGSTGVSAYAHGNSEELIVVLAGAIKLELDADVFHLDQGDSITYDSSKPHRLINAGETPAEVMWVISPPSY